jgi:hypothetical protein
VDGELSDLGDASVRSASSWVVLDGFNEIMRFYRTNGATNEDWYSWHVEVHALFDGVVIEIGKIACLTLQEMQNNHLPVASSSSEQMEVVVVYAHLDDVTVRKRRSRRRGTSSRVGRK